MYLASRIPDNDIRLWTQVYRFVDLVYVRLISTFNHISNRTYKGTLMRTNFFSDPGQFCPDRLIATASPGCPLMRATRLPFEKKIALLQE
jgi:hypothetical protein